MSEGKGLSSRGLFSTQSFQTGNPVLFLSTIIISMFFQVKIVQFQMITAGCTFAKMGLLV